MATIKYLIKGNKDLSTIYVRLRDGRQTDVTASTGYTINPIFWSDAKGTVKQTALNPEKLNLGKNLELLQRKIGDSLNAEKGNGTVINREWLELIIERYKNPLLEQKTESFVELIKAYQSKMKTKVNQKTGRLTAPTTIRNFNTTIMRFEKFEGFKKKHYYIHDIDLTFHSEYINFASRTLNLSINSISKDVKQIKTICLDARDNGYSINKQVESRKFNAPQESTSFVTLNEQDIEKIRNFKGTDYLQNAKDWLIIGCWTGCRVNDLMKLTKENIFINHGNGRKFIRYTQSKTNKQVDIPIHPHVFEIIERLGGFPRPISDQRFNEWIKIVCKQTGITDEVEGTRQNPKSHLKEAGIFEKWELVRSHTCRRSFATNQYNKFPNKVIMAVTGHSTERMLLSYIGETENTHLWDFMAVWDIEQVKEENSSVLKEISINK